ncbi:MAG: beta-galactosidase, partial [Clostridia bacterium]|nr:beta-galactosidase [Clostridia bacterium]
MAIYRKTGKIKPILSKNATDMRFGVGMEKLDRNVFDPNKTYKPVSELGVKRVRLQSGWMRTERKRGEYDFKWLDEIVDNLLSLGIRPWLCLCYGNPLYTERAKHVFGGVGCPPVFSDEEKKAWANYCKATAVHFKGRITEYEVWNEPDGEHCWKHGVNGKEYGEFAILTAKAVKSGDENAEILGGSVFSRD